MFNRKTQNLPAVQSSIAVALVSESEAAPVVPGRVPKTVQRGVLEIMLAFPTQGMADGNSRILRDLYLEAVEGLPRAVVEWTLKYLVFNNPRNTANFTCRPTPQDVREACQATDRCWQRSVVDFYFSGVWAKPSTNTMLTKDNADLLQRYYALQRGGPPGDADCIIPLDLCLHYLRKEIERQLPHVENDEQRRAQQFVEAPLLTIKDDVLDRMPEAAFPRGALETIRAKRAARAEAARKAAEHEAYLAALPDLVRSVRRIVVMSSVSNGWTEDQIMTETKLRLAKIQREKADCQANRAIYVGTSFNDGSEFVELPADRRRAAFAALEMTDEEFERRKAEMIEQLRKEGFEI